MTPRAMAGVAGRTICLALVLFVCFSLAALVSGVVRPPAAATAQTQAPIATTSQRSAAPASTAAKPALMILLYCLAVSGVFAYAILNSQADGWGLVGFVYLAHFGLGTVMSQIESLIFLQHKFSAEFIWRVVAMGAITSTLFSPLAVLLMGKDKPVTPASETKSRPFAEWTWKLLVIAALFTALYFTFGYFVAMKEPAVLAYYHDRDPGGFHAQLVKVWNRGAWLFPFQALRGVMWVGFAWPLLSLVNARRGGIALAAAALLGVWSLALLIPNPSMPETVRLAHLKETLPSSMILGLVMGALLASTGECIKAGLATCAERFAPNA